MNNNLQQIEELLTQMDTLMHDQEFRELLLEKIREYNLK